MSSTPEMCDRRTQLPIGLLVALSLTVAGVLVLPAEASARLPLRAAHDPGRNPLRDVLRFLGSADPVRPHRPSHSASRHGGTERFAMRRPRVVVPADMAENGYADDGPCEGFATRRPHIVVPADVAGYGYADDGPYRYGGYRAAAYPAYPNAGPSPFAYYGRPYGYRPYGPAYFYVPYGR